VSRRPCPFHFLPQPFAALVLGVSSPIIPITKPAGFYLLHPKLGQFFQLAVVRLCKRTQTGWSTPRPSSRLHDIWFFHNPLATSPNEAVSEDFQAELVPGPSNARKSFPRPTVEPRERTAIPLEPATHHEATPTTLTDFSVVVRMSEPRPSDPCAQDPRRITEIASTVIELLAWHQKELDKTVFAAMNLSANSRTGCYDNHGSLCICSPARLKTLTLKETASSAAPPVPSVPPRLCDLPSIIPLASNSCQRCSAISKDLRVELAPDASSSEGYFPCSSTGGCDRCNPPRSPTRQISFVLEETPSPARPPVPPVSAWVRIHFPTCLLISVPGSSYSPISEDFRSELVPHVLDPRRYSPRSSNESVEQQIASSAMATTRNPARPSPVHPHLVVRSNHQSLITDAPPLATRKRHSVARGTHSYPESPAYPRRRHILLVTVALLTFTIILSFFATVSQVFAGVPLLSATVLVNSFPPVQYFVTTLNSEDVLSIGYL
jgi:hypothetical protein